MCSVSQTDSTTSFLSQRLIEGRPCEYKKGDQMLSQRESKESDETTVRKYRRRDEAVMIHLLGRPHPLLSGIKVELNNPPQATLSKELLMV